jgi:hypothetical protein
MSLKKMMPMTLSRKKYHLHVLTVEVTLLVLKSPPVLVEGGREWPCHLGWVHQVDGNNPGGNGACCISKPLDGV